MSHIAAIGIREVKRPYSDTIRGYRIKAAEPNKHARNRFTGKPCTSFAPAFLLAESSDFLTEEEAHQNMQAFLQRLLLRGFDTFIN